jgi:6-phospho-beta-glucosidase
VDPIGLNHLSWFRHIRVDGEDILPELIERDWERLGRRSGVAGELIRELGVLPSYYLHYYYEHDAAVRQLKQETPRAQVVADTEAELLAIYADETVDEKPPQLDRRGGAWYSEAATALLASLVAGTGDTHVVNVPNRGTIAGLADDDIIETLCRVDIGGAVPLPQAPVAPELLGLIQHVSAYERLAVEAARTGDRAVVRRALLAHPLVGQWSLAVRLEELLMETGARYLPQFDLAKEAE